MEASNYGHVAGQEMLDPGLDSIPPSTAPGSCSTPKPGSSKLEFLLEESLIYSKENEHHYYETPLGVTYTIDSSSTAFDAGVLNTAMNEKKPPSKIPVLKRSPLMNKGNIFNGLTKSQISPNMKPLGKNKPDKYKNVKSPVQAYIHGHSKVKHTYVPQTLKEMEASNYGHVAGQEMLDPGLDSIPPSTASGGAIPKRGGKKLH